MSVAPTVSRLQHHLLGAARPEHIADLLPDSLRIFAMRLPCSFERPVLYKIGRVLDDAADSVPPDAIQLVKVGVVAIRDVQRFSEQLLVGIKYLPSFFDVVVDDDAEHLLLRAFPTREQARLPEAAHRPGEIEHNVHGERVAHPRIRQGAVLKAMLGSAVLAGEAVEVPTDRVIQLPKES